MSNNFNKKKRSINLDLIRSVAVFSVLSVHFFLNNGFYTEAVDGIKMYIMVVMRTLFMICVPLFLLLTGYLMCNKKLCKNYYYGIVKTLAIYVLASLFCMLFKGCFFDIHYTIHSMITDIIKFSGAQYSWYIEMYIGLFILIPFFNLIWDGLKNKKEHQILLFTLLFCTMFPSLFEFFDFLIPDIMPDYWEMLWPITYYFLGVYFRKYDINISKRKNIILFLICVMIFGTNNYFMSHNCNFIWKGTWGSFENVTNSVLIFLFLSHLSLEKLPEWIQKIITKISELSLAIYLISECFDKLFYPILNKNIPVMQNRLLWYPVIVPIVFLCSMFFSQILVWIYQFISNCFRKIHDYIFSHYNLKRIFFVFLYRMIESEQIKNLVKLLPQKLIDSIKRNYMEQTAENTDSNYIQK